MINCDKICFLPITSGILQFWILFLRQNSFNLLSFKVKDREVCYSHERLSFRCQSCAEDQGWQDVPLLPFDNKFAL